MSRMIQFHELDKVAESLKSVLLADGATYHVPESSWDREYKRELRHASGLTTTITGDRYSYSNLRWDLEQPEDDAQPDMFRQVARLARATALLLETFNKVTAATRAEREAKEKAARAEREAEYQREREAAAKRREERAKLVEERNGRMLTEFMGESVRVRVRGYRSAVKAVVDGRAVRKYNPDTRVSEDTGEFRAVVRYVNDNDYNRPNQVGDIERLEIKVGSRYELVWDDNPDADGSGSRDVREYDGGLEPEVSAHQGGH